MNAKEIIKNFDELIPQADCELVFSNPFELLVAVILSAQCTDKRVNKITKDLFKIAKTPEEMKELKQEELEKIIFSCGLYKNKAKNIILASKDICERFNGKVPSKKSELVSLSGVGNKTANVVMAVAFGEDAFAVDTHVLRTANRLSLVKTSNPDICEKKLKEFFPKKNWSRLHYQMVLFGRYKCKAQNPDCNDCPFQNICTYFKSKNK